jgi:hypothetical protein
MTDTPCRYFGDRDAAFVSFLYDDIDPAERASFNAHLASCVSCREELAAMTAVRAQLPKWTPPERVAPSGLARPRSSGLPRWRDIPVWAEVAAAILVLSVSAGIANLNVHYGADGLSVRTGWSKPAAPVPAQDAAPWRAEVAALRDQLRSEMQSAQAHSQSPAAQPAASRIDSASDADLMRRVRALVDESEHRQQRELALRVADVMRDVETERRADLVKIDRNLGLLQNNTGVEVMRNRQMLDYLVRVSQSK